jgi:hypothetical protein
MRIAAIGSYPIQQRPGAAMDQSVRTRKKELPPDHPRPVPGKPPDPGDPDRDIDTGDEVIDIRLPGGDAPTPDVDPPRERASSTANPATSASERLPLKRKP